MSETSIAKRMKLSESHEDDSNDGLVISQKQEIGRPTIKEFEDWLITHGAKFSNISMVENDSNTSDGFGVSVIAAKGKQVSEDDLVAYIPQSLIVSPAFVLASQVVKDLVATCQSIDEEIPAYNVQLYSFMIDQKFNGGKWKEYMRMIPSQTLSTMYWKEEELSDIEHYNLHAFTIEETKRLQEICHRYFTIALTSLPQYSKTQFNWSSFLWAHMACRSRGFPVDLALKTPVTYHLSSSNIIVEQMQRLAPETSNTKDTQKSQKEKEISLESQSIPTSSLEGIDFAKQTDQPCILLPLLDMLNHSHNAPIHWEATPNKLSFVSGTEYKEGEEIFNNYGFKSNEELLFGYGFCLADNPHDYIGLKINMNQVTSLHSIILSRFGLSPTGRVNGKKIPVEFLATIRVLAMSPEDVSNYILDTNLTPLEFISDINEVKTYEILYDMIVDKIKRTSTSMEKEQMDDLEWLRENEFSKKYLAVLYRSGQRKVYLEMKKMVSDKLTFLLQTNFDKEKFSFFENLQIELGEHGPTTKYGSCSVLKFEKDIEKEEVLPMKQPHFVISKQSLEKDKKFDNILKCLGAWQLDDDTMFTLFLLYEYSKSDLSDFHSFFQEAIQRKLWRHSILLWSDSDLDLLCDELLINETKEFKYQIEQTYNELFPELSSSFPDCFNRDKCSLEMFLWFTLVSDNCSYLIRENDGVRQYLVLLPSQMSYSPFSPIRTSIEPKSTEEKGAGDNVIFKWESKIALKKGDYFSNSFGSRQLNNYDLLPRFGMLSSCESCVSLLFDVQHVFETIAPIHTEILSSIGLGTRFHIRMGKKETKTSLLFALYLCSKSPETLQSTPIPQLVKEFRDSDKQAELFLLAEELRKIKLKLLKSKGSLPEKQEVDIVLMEKGKEIEDNGVFEPFVSKKEVLFVSKCFILSELTLVEGLLNELAEY